MKRKVHYFINDNNYFIKFIYTLIILNVFSIILESYKEIRIEFGQLLYYVELFSVIIFSIEYILRLWTSNLFYNFNSIFKSQLKFATSKLGLIDLISILPFYLPLLFPFDLRVIRILRLLRLVRIFKLGRLSKSLKTITSVLRETRGELSITIFVAFILLVLSSTLMYFIESDVQPDKFENIGQALWWSVATLTTVGYGDVYPITATGKILSALIALIGIGFIALPTGIISSAFIEKIQEKKNKVRQCECPNCGTEFKA